jgi:hypothetical protein
LKAYRLTDRFMEFFQKGQFTQSKYVLSFYCISSTLLSIFIH